MSIARNSEKQNGKNERKEKKWKKTIPNKMFRNNKGM